MKNSTDMTQFILLGLTNALELQVCLFIMFTIIYLITLIGTLEIIVLTLLDFHLHTPIYFFLSDLSLVDLCYSSAVIPMVVTGCITVDRVISRAACAAQMFFFVPFATVESYLLASIAYDHYAAVCKPLHYTTTMTTAVCACLAIDSYVCGFLNTSIHAGNTFSLSFCVSNVVQHFFCDVPAVMALSCSDRNVSELVLVYVVSFNITFALLVILISYIFIFITILKMNSASGYKKTMSTCASHLTAVSIFCGTIISMYLQPSSSHSMDTDKMASAFYTMIILMLNPVVYSLRNKEVKIVFLKVVLEAKLSLGL